MKSQTTPQYVSDRDLAAMYSVSQLTIWRWAKAGRIPAAEKLGPNTTRWNLAEVQAALAKAAEADAGKRTPGNIAAQAAYAAKGKAAAAQAKADRAHEEGDAA